MFKDISITCPSCSQTTQLGVSVPDPGMHADHRVAMTMCRRCGERYLCETRANGSVYLYAMADLAGNVTPAPIDITADANLDLTEVQRLPFALWQPRGNEIGGFEHRPEWEAPLREALQRAQQEPRPLSVPRRVFVSYRWGGKADDEWVARLARELETRANAVVFDRAATAALTVPELVSRIANCHVFLSVLDPGYVERIYAASPGDRREGWVTDEFHTAAAFARAGLINMIGLLRSGEQLPPGFRPFAHGEAGNTFDVREDSALPSVLDQFFSPLGPTPEPQAAAAAASALAHSYTSLRAGDVEDAHTHAQIACEQIPELCDGFAQRARVRHARHAFAGAFDDAQRALRSNPALDEMALLSASCACELRNWREAGRNARLAAERNIGQNYAHLFLGRSLLELEQHEAALAHLQIARAGELKELQMYNYGGWALSCLGRPVEALEWFQRGLTNFPDADNLLANGVIAAIEAGKTSEAYEHLVRLADVNPSHPQLGPLTQALANWCNSDGPPPRLGSVAEPSAPVGAWRCADCSAAIHVSDEQTAPCFGCGALRSLSERVCGFCAAEGKLLPASFPESPTELAMKTKCPYCRAGEFRYEAAKEPGGQIR